MRRRQAFALQSNAVLAGADIPASPPRDDAKGQDSAVYSFTGFCPKCAKPLKKRGAHLHIRACKA